MISARNRSVESSASPSHCTKTNRAERRCGLRHKALRPIRAATTASRSAPRKLRAYPANCLLLEKRSGWVFKSRGNPSKRAYCCCLKISVRKSARDIARDFNCQGLPCCGERWTDQRILDILCNQKYIGWAVWGRTTGPLGKKRVDAPQAKWIVNPAAFEGLIDPQTFDSAQRAIADRTCNKSNEHLLDNLRSLLKKEGRLSQHLIEASKETPSSATYHHRFGSLRQAYALIGYKEFRNHGGMLKMRRRHRKVELALVARIAKALQTVGRIVRERNVCRRVVCLQNGARISVLISQCISLPSGNLRWAIKVNRFEREYPTLLCRCTQNDRGIRDMHLMPRIDTTYTNRFRISETDPWLKPGERIEDLSELPRAVDRVLRKNENASTCILTPRCWPGSKMQ